MINHLSITIIKADIVFKPHREKNHTKYVNISKITINIKKTLHAII